MGGMGGMGGMGMPGMGGMGGPMGGMGMGGGGMPGNPFGGSEEKLKANPRIAKYFEDPQFKVKWELCQQNPQMMMQVMQTDPRFMDVFKELTGIDLGDMQEKEMKRRDDAADVKKEQEAAAKAKQAAEEQKKKEEEEAALPAEERARLDAQKEAAALKLEGNAAYKAKDFENALSLYQQAIDKDPKEITYYSNKAAVYFEMKKYDECIEQCDLAAKTTEGGAYDYVKLAKAIARKANALLQQQKFDESIATY